MIRSLLRILPLLIFCITTNAQSIQQLDSKYGFKGIKLDEPISSLSIQMEFVSSYDNVYSKYLVIDNSYYNIGETKLSGVIVETISNKVFKIYLQTEGTENLKGLLGSFVSYYGPPTETEDEENSITYIWQTNMTTLSYYIDLDDGINTKGLALFYSKKMFELDKKLKAQKAESEL